MTVRELIAIVRERLPDDWALRLSDLRIIYALNRAYKRFCYEAYAIEATVEFNVPPNIGVWVLPDWVAVIRAANWRTQEGTRFPLTPISRYLVETNDPMWRDNWGVGTPSHYFVYSNKEIALVPCPDAGGCLEARCVLLPSDDPTAPIRELVSLEDSPAFKELFHEALVDGALAHLYLAPLDRESLQLHAFYEQRFRNWVKQFKEYVDTLDDRSLEVNTFLLPQPITINVNLPMPVPSGR